eukprot:NODE_471_length_7033_cov_0.382031.p4 type:complete len:211 gc:universal NODE_471_length_7033_cov_0.382031:6514-5882(-)
MNRESVKLLELGKLKSTPKNSLKQVYFSVFSNSNLNYHDLLKINDPVRPVNALFYAARYISSNFQSLKKIRQIWNAVRELINAVDPMNGVYGKLMNDLFNKIFDDLYRIRPKLSKKEILKKGSVKISELFQDEAIAFYLKRPGTLKTQRNAIRAISMKYHVEYKVYWKLLPSIFNDEMKNAFRPSNENIRAWLPHLLIQRVKLFENGLYF